MIEHITSEELQEVIALTDKGWSACSLEEKSRWTKLHAKAHLAKAKQSVLEIIEIEKAIRIAKG